jgi:hypothetical protein
MEQSVECIGRSIDFILSFFVFVLKSAFTLKPTWSNIYSTFHDHSIPFQSTYILIISHEDLSVSWLPGLTIG